MRKEEIERSLKLLNELFELTYFYKNQAGEKFRSRLNYIKEVFNQELNINKHKTKLVVLRNEINSLNNIEK